MRTASVLIIGSGAVGRLIAQDLRYQCPHLLLTVASRAPEAWRNPPEGVVLRRVNAEDPEAMLGMLADFDLAVLALGPFSRYGGKAHELCIEAGVNCLDINDSVETARRILALGEQAHARSVRILTGMGLAPGLSTWLLLRLKEEDHDACRDFSMRLYMGALHGGGPTATHVLIENFCRETLALRNGCAQSVPTPWRDERSTYLFPGQDEPFPLIPFSSPEVVTLTATECAARLGIENLDCRYHAQFLPRALARLVALAHPATRDPRAREFLARLFYRAGRYAQRRISATGMTTLVVEATDASSPRRKLVHGEISPAHLTAAFAASIVEWFSEEGSDVPPGVYPFESLPVSSTYMTPTLGRRGIVAVDPDTVASRYRRRFGASTAAAVGADSLRHYRRSWYGLETLSPVIAKLQRRCLLDSRLWAEVRRLSLAQRTGLYVHIALTWWRLYGNLSSGFDNDGIEPNAWRRIRRDFSLFAAAYRQLRRRLGGDAAHELYRQMFLDSGAMEMTWFWPDGELLRYMAHLFLSLREYFLAYLEDCRCVGVLQYKIRGEGAAQLEIEISECLYARLFAYFNCSELGDLVRLMEVAALRELAAPQQALVEWMPAGVRGLGCLRLTAATRASFPTEGIRESERCARFASGDRNA